MTDNDIGSTGSDGTTLTYLEFYSGIGGWTLALEKACRDIAANTNTNTSCATNGGDGAAAAAVTGQRISVQRLASYDHSDLCNAVFAHNFVSDGDTNDIGDDKKPSAGKRQKKKQKRNDASSSSATTAAAAAAAARRPPPPPASLPTYPIEKLTATDLAKLNADIWAMSPPCQPHTRQHDHHSTEEELSDPRSKSFLHLIELMYELGSSSSNGNTVEKDDCGGNDLLPKIILLENVVGFEASTSCQKYKQALVDNGYVFAELHLNPTQVGIPNDRPRYYCCAVKGAKQDDTKGQNSIGDVLHQLVDLFRSASDGSNAQLPNVHTSIPSLGVAEPGSPNTASSLPSIASYLDTDLPPLALDGPSTNASKLDKVQIPKMTIEKSAAWCFDIITRDDARSACFTSSYGKYVKGTGSVLYYGNDGSAMNASAEKVESKCDGQATDVFRLVDPKERSYDATWWERLVVAGDGASPPLRYLSGEEVARLMGFPLKGDTADISTHSDSAFSFPEWCTEKQKWRLLGNSINVAVSARIAELGMRLLISKRKS